MFGTYGVIEATAAHGDLEQITEELTVRGFAVMADVYAPAQVAELNAALDAVYRRQCHEIGGEEKLASIGDVDIARCPLAYDARFLDMALRPEILSVARSLFGPAVVLMMQNGIINRPDRIQAQTKWHRDLNYQHWTSSKPLAIGALVCLEDFNEETGGTVFLPSTHKFEQFPSQDLVERMEVRPEVAAGSVIFFDSMIFHRAGINKSGRIRRAVNHVIGVPILAQAIDIPAMLQERPSHLDGEAMAYLGYRWNPVRSVEEWRRMKLDVSEN